MIECDGDGFLRHMVRAIAGTLAEIGTGLRPPSAMREILDARDRRAAGATAPAAGLTLDVRETTTSGRGHLDRSCA